MSTSTTLYFKQGSSDKVYQCSIEPSGGLFVVNFTYGRRGGPMQTGTKTQLPVSRDDAHVVYDKLVREKTAKGYTPGKDGTPYQHTDKVATGLLPQLLNSIDEAEALELIEDHEWAMQEKLDGRRMLVRKAGNDIVGTNKKGLAVGLPENVVDSLLASGSDFVLDGEMVGDVFHAFDLLERRGIDMREVPYRERLVELVALLGNGCQCVKLVATAYSTNEKNAMLAKLVAGKKEGAVFKRLDAPYTVGRPNSGGNQRKHKFYATLSAVVASVNQKRSVVLELLDGGKEWVPCGNVTIPPNHVVPVAGAVVEVRYLYSLRASGCLYQPNYLGVRDDVEPDECLVAQLKFKGDEDEA